MLGIVVTVLATVAGGVAPAQASGAYGRFGLPLSVNPYNPAAQQLRAQSGASAETKLLLNRIASEPQGDWYGGSTASVAASVRSRVNGAAQQHAIAQLVMYNLPYRDCGMYSASGWISASQYRAWVRSFVQGLGTHRAIVIVEPDALMQATQCLTAAQRSQRYALIASTVAALHAQGSWAYIDAGHANGLSARTIANRLKASDIAQAAGFSLNVSGWETTAASIRYGTQVSNLVGGRHFVIDTSRNGIAPTDSAWCNPPDKGLGHAPTEVTHVAKVDAYLWIKNPGGSDGTCNGGPSSGQWWQSYALMLARNAHLS